MNKNILSVSLLIASLSLTACGGGGSSVAPPVATPSPVAGCYGHEPNGTSVFLSIYSCDVYATQNPQLYATANSKYAPLVTIGTPPTPAPTQNVLNGGQ